MPLTGRLLSALFLSTFAATPAAAQTAPPALLAGVTRIVTLGDSITQGGGQPGGYVWLMERYLNATYPPIEIVNAGIYRTAITLDLSQPKK